MRPPIEFPSVCLMGGYDIGTVRNKIVEALGYVDESSGRCNPRTFSGRPDDDCQWIQGPAFLRKDKEHRPEKPRLPLNLSADMERKRPKRWGCLSTCLTTHATHLEVLASQDVDAIRNAIERFSTHKSTPERIIRQRHIHASDMEDVWKQQIRTVRKVLQALIGSEVLDNECLQTFFCDVVAVVNEWLITPISDDVNDLEALMPMPILRPGTTCNLPRGGLLVKQSYCRRWKNDQFLEDLFWKCWMQEYVPLLRICQTHLKPQRNFRPNDMVIVARKANSWNQWPLIRAIE
ncbi:uncharacterized protein LOC121874325 [Homarus americanus]|uniref:uncharacterized protein LOC121858197 n=1 Tax=Homarus americanus TaxID=6706 RepID=UPI001C484E1B|nr:uncharacterized protein LOC121858197 [Homarus americanus]XP_042234366.1 uncharacterized protein LOC121874325 [Homarus americanus]